MQIHPAYSILLLLPLLCCKNVHPPESRNDHGANTMIDIQPFRGMPPAQVDYVLKELLKVYPHIRVNKELDYPVLAFNRERGRYRADSLIIFLNRRTADQHITIGLTPKDISTTKDGIKDWGVMGLGFRPGNACITSTFRLSKTNTSRQLFKVAIHELGHTEGLPHCPEETCFMRDAEGKNTTDQEQTFCPRCKKTLTEKGWQF